MHYILAGYTSSVTGKFGGGHQVVRCGLTPYEAAARAAQLMIEYSQSNSEGVDLMSPPEVMELVPEHLRSITPEAQDYPCAWCNGDACDCSHCGGTGIAGDE